MDYEKKYKEAMKACKELSDSFDNEDLTEELEKIFPELKESDDERARKALFELISTYLRGNENGKIHGVFAKDILAWLEKQGEQKPMDIEDALKEEYKKGWDTALLQLPKEVDSQIWQIANNSAKTWEESFAILNATQKAYDKGKNDVLKAQHNAWSEEDETTKNNISHIIRQYDKISKRENQPCWYVGDCLLWMQNIKDRVQPQPKQEWSEEDEYYYGIIQYILNNECVGKTDKDNAINWFKSLRPQSQWRPSAEQIEALKEACDEHWEPDGLDPLYTLYQNLKKLREE